MQKTFKKSELLDLGLPRHCKGGKVIEDKIEDQGRWTTTHDLVFQLPGQDENEAWATWYEVGSTERQEQRPWEDDSEVECKLVHKIEKLVTVWE